MIKNKHIKIGNKIANIKSKMIFLNYTGIDIIPCRLPLKKYMEFMREITSSIYFNLPYPDIF